MLYENDLHPKVLTVDLIIFTIFSFFQMIRSYRIWKYYSQTYYYKPKYIITYDL